MPLQDSQKIPCPDVDHFLEALNMARWSEGKWTSDWVFRGESDSSRPLRPTAWRDNKDFLGLYEQIDNRITPDDVDPARDCHELFGMGTLPRDYATNKTNTKKIYVQIEYEEELLRLFAELLNQMGLPIPNSVSLKGSFLPYPCFINGKRLLPMMALAQHHGIPTRIIDWSINPFKALFFGIKYQGVKNKDICVWAWRCKNQLESTKDGIIERLDVERSLVGNLHAQEGCFSHDTDAASVLLDTGKWPGMEERVHPANLKQVTIHGKHKRELLRRLYLMGYSFHTMMPSIDSIAKAMKTMTPEDKKTVTDNMKALG